MNYMNSALSPQRCSVLFSCFITDVIKMSLLFLLLVLFLLLLVVVAVVVVGVVGVMLFIYGIVINIKNAVL